MGQRVVMGRSNDELEDFLTEKYGPPAINLKAFTIDDEVIGLVSRDVAERYRIVPVNRAGPNLIVATSAPSNQPALDDLARLTGYRIKPVVASEAAISQAIARYYGSDRGK